MVQLNRDAADTLRALPAGWVHACTDVTGFGLIGHASEVAAASHVSLRLDARAVPILTGALALAGDSKSGGLRSNLDHFEARARIADGLDPSLVLLLFDPQTSGGLLIAAAAEHAAAVDKALTRAGVVSVRIGEALPVGDCQIEVV
jgi:selenide,water dikinase